MDQYELYFDGCSLGNPGLSGSGCVIYKNGEEIWAESYFVGDKSTNNEAEYMGLIHGLLGAINLGIKTLIIRGDSQLILNQMMGIYQVRSISLLLKYDQAKNLEQQFEEITYEHVLRHLNKRADKLSKIGATRG